MKDYSKEEKISVDLKSRIDAFLHGLQVDKRSVKASEVYALYNEITGKREKTSTCASCIRQRIRFIQSYAETNNYLSEL